MVDLLALLRIVLMGLAGIALGLGATTVLLDPATGFGSVKAGPWRMWPKAGTLEMDPYTRARLAKSGEIPMGLAEGLMMVATTDAKGNPLSRRCDYVLTGHVPPARYWTLTVNNGSGYLTGPAGIRRGLTSAEILRRADGFFEIQLSANARPGNWLPLAGDDEFILVLRLYDTAIGGTASVIEAGTVPDLVAGACR